MRTRRLFYENVYLREFEAEVSPAEKMREDSMWS